MRRPRATITTNATTIMMTTSIPERKGVAAGAFSIVIVALAKTDTPLKDAITSSLRVPDVFPAVKLTDCVEVELRRPRLVLSDQAYPISESTQDDWEH
jgi:hypothetical protein